MINTIYQMGDDALNNQATVSITPLSFMSQTDALKLRIKGFKTPEYKIQFYDISYKGYKIGRAKPGDPDLDRKLSFQFRVDKYYSIYKDLLAWGKMIYDHQADDAGLGDNMQVRTEVVIAADNGPTWTFTGCIFESIDPIEFDQTSDGEPINVELNLRFLDYTIV